MSLLSFHYFLLLVPNSLCFALWSPSKTLRLSPEATVAASHRGLGCSPEIHRLYL